MPNAHGNGASRPNRSKSPSGRREHSRPISPADLARKFYGWAFEARRQKAFSAAVKEWADFTEGEQRFAVAHLHYLNLEAQSVTQQLLFRIGRQLRMTDDAVQAMADELLEGGPELDSEEKEDQDAFFEGLEPADEADSEGAGNALVPEGDAAIEKEPEAATSSELASDQADSDAAAGVEAESNDSEDEADED